ncbi:MAG: UDP-N-acetylmuramoyl-tripeptide--D-alanyl-D-alanine ligase [Treponema sp.]|jgi:UDP-N-acetylmuramoyl-tripeptide--D-alanyl-D-alanine ligase|nr:UDP-N-acetylmuramoyl-tripeptide--D-alanyl-D-alanine ligase [Treponema sp.]
MDFSSLSQSLGARLLSFGNSQSGAGFSSVTVDSRTAREGSLFAALPGSNCDGHSFVEAAFKNGACAALVEHNKIETFYLDKIAKSLGKALVIVDNSLEGLQKAAAAYLKKFPGLLRIAITGSSGKTTTKEIAAKIIGIEKSVVINPGNYNSDIGLPLSVFNIRRCHEIAVFEAGMNRVGEIAELASVFFPDVALITNIGSAHIGILGSRDAIALEKKNIFSQFNGKGVALIPADSPYRDYLAQGVQGRVSFYGEKSFAELGGVKDLGLDGSEIVWDGKQARFALPGRFNLANAFAAIAIAQEIPVSAEAVRRGIESVKPLFGRGEIIHGKATVIKDCYNSNPESLAGALEFCESLDWPGRRVYVIGEMLELGEDSKKAHEGMGRLLADSKADMVFLYGKETAAGLKAFKSGRFFHTCDINEMRAAVNEYVRDGDLVLLKGSRGCALERVFGEDA